LKHFQKSEKIFFDFFLIFFSPFRPPLRHPLNWLYFAQSMCLQAFAKVNASRSAPVLMFSQNAQISRVFQGMLLTPPNSANCTV
jgi:hypothetical protein